MILRQPNLRPILNWIFAITFVSSFVMPTTGFAMEITPSTTSEFSGTASLSQTRGTVAQLGNGLNETELAASRVVSQEFSRQISTIEWLAPLAPVALSPFFGIALLSGLACYGPDWLPDNALLGPQSPLANPAIFWIFATLTCLTSAPRFSKVSKPVAQLADFLETYSAIVILFVMKLISVLPEPAAEIASSPIAMQSGLFSAGWEGLIMLAMAINIIVINSVKFFFEILVWITPIPFLDACFEAANKSLCAGLMAIYAISPIAALVINILLFVVCALAFAWIRRREIYFRTMLIDWLMQYFSLTIKVDLNRLTVFPMGAVGSIPARSRCQFEKVDEGWTLTQHRLLGGPRVESITGMAELEIHWWTNTITIDDTTRLTFSRRYQDHIAAISTSFGLGVSETNDREKRLTPTQLEFT